MRLNRAATTAIMIALGPIALIIGALNLFFESKDDDVARKSEASDEWLDWRGR